MFVFALTVQNGLRADAPHGGLAILPMALLFAGLFSSVLADVPMHLDGVGSGC